MSEVVDILLSPAERNRLGELEGIVEHGMQTFVEVGRALAEIRESLLYRDTHDTFEAYCRERWDMSRVHAKRLVAAAETVALVTEPNGSVPLPPTESAARELAPLREQPEKLRQAWQEAVEVSNGKPTAKDVKTVVEQYRDTTPTRAGPQYSTCPTCGHRVRADKPLRPREESR